MAGEANQAKWVGTRKVDPAIGDLQAIEEVLQFFDQKVLTATATYIVTFGPVPTGKIWMISNALAYSINPGSAIRIDVVENTTIKTRLDYKITTTSYTFCGYPAVIVLDEGQHLSFEFYGYSNTNTVISTCVGYQIDKY